MMVDARCVWGHGSAVTRAALVSIGHIPGHHWPHTVTSYQQTEHQPDNERYVGAPILTSIFSIFGGKASQFKVVGLCFNTCLERQALESNNMCFQQGKYHKCQNWTPVASAALLTPHFSLQHSCDQIQFWPDKYCSNKNTEYL